MSEPAGQAVFLSYASQDAEAAMRLCEALRAAGVEVWFDQSELVGGDAWDRKIRGQIASCGLFVPVISAATQARREGYFRIEWKLAAQRTHAMADGTPFVLPVVIDATRDADALVPDEFRAVQWTRIGSADSLAAFGGRVKKLLGGSGAVGGALRPDGSEDSRGEESPRKESRRKAAPTGKPGRAWIIPAIIALVTVATLGLWRPWITAPAKSAPTASSPAAQPLLDFVDAKSIAVLPFVNLSSDKENEYLSDGITEEILNVLTKVPGLRVPARTSSFVFKGKTDDIKKIGELLRVATVLEGSVQRSGDQLRVTAQLINVADGYHLWSEKYDRPMTNIFEIQDDIARTIVAKLKISLTRSTGLLVAKRGTENVEAYALHLKGRFYVDKRTESDLRLAITHFEAALTRQPDYALAYAGLASAYSLLRFYAYAAPGSITPPFRAAVAKALELDDTLSEAHGMLASLHFIVDWDWGTAEREFKRALELDPANVDAHSLFSQMLALTGRPPEAVAEVTKAQQLDPLSVAVKGRAAATYLLADDLGRALEVARQAIAMTPDYFPPHQTMGIALFRKGEREAGIVAMEKAAQLAYVPAVLGYLGQMYGRVGRKAEAQKVLDQLLTLAKQQYVPAQPIANVYAGLGDFEQANVWMNRAIAERESSLVYLKGYADDVTRANPHYAEWLKKIGLDK